MRPRKQGLEYFPLDTDFLHDDKVTALLSRAGTAGLGVFVGILAELFRVGGCYRLRAFDLESLALKLRMDKSELETAIGHCVDCRLFDRRVLEESGFLTSKAIQERYFTIAGRRTKIRFPASALLVYDKPDNVFLDQKEIDIDSIVIEETSTSDPLLQKPLSASEPLTETSFPQPKAKGRPNNVINIIDSLNGVWATESGRNAIEEWIRYRSQIKRPLKPMTVERLAKKWGNDLERFKEAVDFTIEKGWQGLKHPDECNDYGRGGNGGRSSQAKQFENFMRGKADG